MIFDFLKLVLKDISGRKFSSFLTFFAISLGILTIFVIVLVSQGFEQSIQKQFEQLGSNRLIIQYKGSSIYSGQAVKGLTDNEVKLLENKPYIKEVHPMLIRNTNVKYGSQTEKRMIFGTPWNEDYFTDYNIEIAQGRYPKESDKYGIVIGPDAATEIFNKDISLGSNIYIKDRKFKVIGILKSVGNPEDDKNIQLSYETMQDIFDAQGQVDYVMASVEDNYDVDIAAKNAKILLENKLGDDTVEVQTFAQMIEQVNTILGIVQATLGGIALVSLIVGAVGIVNTMFVIITEKTKDIGIMKAIGATNKDIFLIYILQAGIFGFLGAIFGTFFGGIGGKLFGWWAANNGYTFLEITINPVAVVSLLAFGFVIGAISGFIPAYRASKLLIVETFRK